MSNTWKGLVIVVLAVAVFAVISGKQHATQTPAASAAGSSGRAVATPPAPRTAANTGAAKQTATRPLSASGTPPKESPKTEAQTKPAPVQAAAAAQKPTATPKRKALPQMIELGSKTCTPCQMMQPILEELRTEYKGQLEVPFWDIYDHPDKAKAYRIRVIPTQVFIGADGKELFRHEGFFPKEDILAKFKEHGVALRGTK